MRRLAPAIVLLITLADCGGSRPLPALAAPVFLTPAEGAVLQQPRIDVALRVPDLPPGARLEVRCGQADISGRFDPPKSRMRSLGGGVVISAILDIEALPGCAAGPLTARVVAGRGVPPVSTRAFSYRPPAGRLGVRVLEGGAAIPARLIISGIEGTPDPDFGTPGMAQVDPRVREERRVFLDSASGEERIVLPPGRYRVLATHGIEYTVAESEVTLKAGSPARLDLALTRILDTPGWISADLHVHASPSMDSFVPLADRVAGYLAAGIEVLVATDHNALTDYSAVIKGMPGAADRLVALIGVETEIRPRRGGAVGHWTLFPFAPAAEQSVRPWPVPRVREPAEIYRLFRDGGEDRHPPGRAGGIIELNHPRGLITEPGGEIRGLESAAYFSAAGFDPERPDTASFLERRDPSGRFANADFDAIEVLNRFSLALYRQVRRDWFALLDSGRSYTGTANSDSHHRVLTGPGFPRNFVEVGDGIDKPATFDADRFDLAVREGRVLGTTGPLIDLRVDGGAGPGSTVRPAGGKLLVRLRVRAAPWVPVREARLVVGGNVVRRWVLRRPLGVVERLSEEVALDLRRDTWLLAEAGQPLDAPDTGEGGIYGSVAPGFVPIAFTNPIRIDVAGDGWKPEP